MYSDPKHSFKKILSVFSVSLTLSMLPLLATAWEASFGLVKESIFIESYVSNVTVNGSSVVNDKIASISVPTKVGSLENDSGFVTESVTNGILVAANKYTDDKIDAINPPLTGKTYDFKNGEKFTRTVYTALTNVIDILGGEVINVPTFKNQGE